jgi:hypothetical protein
MTADGKFVLRVAKFSYTASSFGFEERKMILPMSSHYLDIHDSPFQR